MNANICAMLRILVVILAIAGILQIGNDVRETLLDTERPDGKDVAIMDVTVTDCTNENGTGIVTANFSNTGTTSIPISTVDMIVKNHRTSFNALSNDGLDLREPQVKPQDDIRLDTSQNGGPGSVGGSASYRIETGSGVPFEPGRYWFDFQFKAKDVNVLPSRCQIP